MIELILITQTICIVWLMFLHLKINKLEKGDE